MKDNKKVIEYWEEMSVTYRRLARTTTDKGLSEGFANCARYVEALIKLEEKPKLDATQTAQLMAKIENDLLDSGMISETNIRNALIEIQEYYEIDTSLLSDRLKILIKNE
jgi:hypothetical protein